MFWCGSQFMFYYHEWVKKVCNGKFIFSSSSLKIDFKNEFFDLVWNKTMKHSQNRENYKAFLEDVIKILMGCLKMWIKIIKSQNEYV